jgi:hypothetical protein
VKRETLFLKIVLFFIGASVLALCIFWLPDVAVEAAGRYQQAVYLPVIIGMYAAAIPFYFVLYQAFNLLLYIDRGKAFSELSVTALKRIKFCALAMAYCLRRFSPCLYIMAQPWTRRASGDGTYDCLSFNCDLGLCRRPSKAA